ncbi:MAG TPA: TonB-dependent receptor [Bacteroidota bacterium]|nr:TonB-dependent receptor [Bacteroidota bacterium]
MNSFCRISLALLLVCVILSPSLVAQSGGVSGKIVNADDQTPLSNVNVVLRDKTIGASTNAEGVYELTLVPAGTYTLQASRVGFKTFRTTVTVGDTKLVLDIRLQPEPIGMNEVIVTGYRESYSSRDNASASRIDAPLMALPLSTGQITNKLLVDQNVINMNDAMRNVSGVTTEAGGPHPLILNIRGFSASIFKDGFKIGMGNNLSAGGDDLPINPIAVDRIEVLKGPSTILYGRGEPGGIVNFISKQPQATPGYGIEAMTGSFQQYRVGGSATGPLFTESVLYRLDGSYEQGNSYRDFVKSKTSFVKPSFVISALENTRIYLAGEISHSGFTPDHGVLMLPSMSSSGVLTASLAPISSRTYNFGESTDNTDQTQQRAVAEVEHVISPNWTVRAGFNYEHVKQHSIYEMDLFYSYMGTMPPGFPPGAFPANMSLRGLDDMNSTRTDFGARLENYVRARHTLFDAQVTHGILLLVDAIQVETKYYMDYNPNQILDPSTGSRMNVPIPVVLHEQSVPTSNDYGISVQDLITIGGRWHLLLGGRYEHNGITLTQLATSGSGETTTDGKSSGFVPRLGALYQVNDNLSLYASYMGSYQAPGTDLGLFDIPSDLKPERAYQTEAGMKLELLNKRALLTASVFMIDKYDVISSERNPAGISPYTLYFNIGKEDASGFDIDVVGEVSSSLRVSASFNAQTMKFTNPMYTLVDGKMRYGTPKSSGNIWAVYEFNEGPVRGFGIGGGVTARGSVFANDANEAKLPGYTTIDATAYYQLANIRFQLNLYNITNELGYTVSNIGGFGNPTSTFFVMPIAPFHMNFTVRYQI